MLLLFSGVKTNLGIAGTAKPDSIFFGSYAFDSYTKLSQKNKSFGLGVLFLGTELDFGNTTFTVSINGTHSTNSPSDFVGDLQVLSNIDTQEKDTLKIYELILEHNFFIRDFNFIFGVGWKDLSGSFNRTETSQNLMHSSFGTSAELGNTGFYGPSIYPFPSFGFHFAKSWNDGAYVMYSIADPILYNSFENGIFQSQINLDEDNFFTIFEFGKKTELYKINLGLWKYRSSGQLEDSFKQSGLYFDGEYNFSQLSPFVKLGLVSQVKNRVSSSFAIGLNLRSLILDKEEISIGFVAAQIQGHNTETAFELQYQFIFSDKFYSPVTYQSIANTFFTKTNASIVALRLGYNFETLY